MSSPAGSGDSAGRFVPSSAQRRDALVTAALIVVNFVVVLGLSVVAVLNVGNRSVFLAVAIPLSIYALSTGAMLTRRWRRASAPPEQRF